MLVKPFDIPELFARLRAIIRRGANISRATLDLSDVHIDTAARTVTRTDLYEHPFDEHEATLSNILDIHVFNLRKKLGQEFITTRRSHGYCIE